MLEYEGEFSATAFKLTQTLAEKHMAGKLCPALEAMGVRIYTYSFFTRLFRFAERFHAQSRQRFGNTFLNLLNHSNFFQLPI
jgi:hypothetical protein